MDTLTERLIAFLLWTATLFVLMSVAKSQEHVETFKFPEQDVLQIEQGKWQEVHFGIILPVNGTRDISGGVIIDHNPSCLDPRTAKPDFINFYPGYVTLCPFDVLNNASVKCQRIVANVHGVEEANNQTISLCLLHYTIDSIQTQKTIYTIQVLDTLVLVNPPGHPATQTVRQISDIQATTVTNESYTFGIMIAICVQSVVIIILFVFTWICIHSCLHRTTNTSSGVQRRISRQATNLTELQRDMNKGDLYATHIANAEHYEQELSANSDSGFHPSPPPLTGGSSSLRSSTEGRSSSTLFETNMAPTLTGAAEPMPLTETRRTLFRRTVTGSRDDNLQDPL